MSKLWSTALLGAALMVPVAMAPIALRAADQKAAITYHDKQNNDDHQWNGQESRAYGAWVKEGHRKNTQFARLNENDQQAYWNWRHQHSDAVLKIDIR
jgi:hypothetical protein